MESNVSGVGPPAGADAGFHTRHAPPRQRVAEKNTAVEAPRWHVELVDVAPPDVRMPYDLVAIVQALPPVQLATALSLLHPADPHLCAARAAIDVADLRHGALRARTEVSHDVAGALLAAGLRTEPIRPVQIPRVPVRCDVCSRAGAVLQPMRGRWVWTPEEIAA